MILFYHKYDIYKIVELAICYLVIFR